ncbi:MAG TPA: hypothetical protein QGF04_04050 [Woeseiaceae bacterium]|jgi:uncharacterized protein YacL (UPF0231 family)|nr:hypothetical protein [Woeseiaceae bacterium]
MSFRNTRIEYKRSEEAAKWLEEEVSEQLQRYKKIVAEMKAMNKERDQWYEDFFSRIQTQGFNTDGDTRVKISDNDLPVKPGADHKVVY